MTKENNKNNRFALISLFIVASGYGLANFHRSSMAVLGPYLADTFNLNSSQLGFLGSMMFYTYGLSQIPIGLAADRWGNKRVLEFCSIFMVLGTFLFAISSSFGALAVSRLILGVAVSGFFVPGVSLIREWFPANRVGFYTAIMVSQGNIFTLLSYAPFEALLNNFSFKNIYIVLSILTILLTIGVFNIKEDQVERSGKRLDLSSFTRPYVIFLLSCSLFGLVFNGSRQAFQTLWATTYYTQVFGFSLHGASRLLMMFTVAGILFGPVSGKVTEYIGNYKTFILLGFSQAVIWFILSLIPASSPIWLIILVSIVLGAVSSVTMSTVFSTLGDYSQPEVRTLSNGILNTFNFFGAAAFTQGIGLVLSDSASNVSAFSNIFLFFAIIIIISLIIVILSKNNLVKKQIFK